MARSDGEGLVRSRAAIGVPELLQQFGVAGRVNPDTFVECLRLFELNYGVEVGLLRSEDLLAVFVSPSKRRNPLAWLADQAATEDRASELNYRLTCRREEIGAPSLGRAPLTVGEYVLAWSGASI